MLQFVLSVCNSLFRMDIMYIISSNFVTNSLLCCLGICAVCDSDGDKIRNYYAGTSFYSLWFYLLTCVTNTS